METSSALILLSQEVAPSSISGVSITQTASTLTPAILPAIYIAVLTERAFSLVPWTGPFTTSVNRIEPLWTPSTRMVPITASLAVFQNGLEW